MAVSTIIRSNDEVYTSLLQATIPLELHITLKELNKQKKYQRLNPSLACDYRFFDYRPTD